VDWQEAEVLDVAPADLEAAPSGAASFATVPKAAGIARNYPAWEKSFAAWLAGSQTLDLRRHAATGLVSRPGEADRDFAIRVQTAQREARDAEVDKLQRKYAEQRARLQERIRRAEQSVSREQEQATQQKLQTAVSFGATVLGALFSNRKLSATTLGRATTAARGLGRSAKEQQDVGRAQDNVTVVRQQLDDLDATIAEETKAIAARYDADAANIEKLSLAPKRGQITVQFVALGWKSA